MAKAKAKKKSKAAPKPKALKSADRRIEYMELDSIKGAKRNPKTHDIEEIKASYQRFEAQDSPVLDERTKRLLSGHGRISALRGLRDAGEPVPGGVRLDGDKWMVPIQRGGRTKDDAEAEAYIVAANNLVVVGGWNSDQLQDVLAGITNFKGIGFSPNFSLPTDGPELPEPGPNLAERFLVPPFSILDTRQGYWQDRKRKWANVGMESEVGRNENLIGKGYDALMDNRKRNEVKKMKSGKGRKDDLCGNLAASGSDYGRKPMGTSIFDPVLCELIYRWFSPKNGAVLDPFAGGSVRGVVAGMLGRDYLGVDLRQEQVDENRKQWTRISGGEEESSTPLKVTPVEVHDGFLVKRDDLYVVAGQPGGKVRTCYYLAKKAKGLVTAGSRQSPQVNIVAGLAKHLGIPCRVHVPSGELTPELEEAKAAGAEIVQHKPGYNSVIIARAKADAKKSKWTEIPFGMECKEAVKQTSGQVASLIDHDFKRLVVPVGSGMSLAGIIAGMDKAGIEAPILGVVVGASPEKRLDKYAPGWRDRVTLVESALDYHDHAPSTALGDLFLDPVYEAKCIPLLEEGDLLWVVGKRQSATTKIAAEGAGDVRWEVGDSSKFETKEKFDLVFSCPPYGDLEVYSDDPNDLSNMGSEKFDATYRKIIARAVKNLRNDRFAVFVVGEYRLKSGGYAGLVPATIKAFEDAGLKYYNEAILVTSVNTLSLRAAIPFNGSRKIGKCHQNVLVFVKGDEKKATKACGEIEVAFPE